MPAMTSPRCQKIISVDDIRDQPDESVPSGFIAIAVAAGKYSTTAAATAKSTCAVG